MPLTNFVDKVTSVGASWLNSIDVLWSTVFGEAATKAAARAALTSDAPMSVGQGGTNATTAAAARTALGAAASGANTDITSIALQGLADLSNAAAGQIKFPAGQNPAADVNTLDDYEEGTWTPSLGGTATYTVQLGQYIKIGKFVYFSGSLTVNVIGTGSINTISGLPFTVDNTLGTPGGTITTFASAAISVVSAYLRVGGTGTSAVVRGLTAAAAGDNTLAFFQNGTQVEFSGWYRALA